MTSSWFEDTSPPASEHPLHRTANPPPLTSPSLPPPLALICPSIAGDPPNVSFSRPLLNSYAQINSETRDKGGYCYRGWIFDRSDGSEITEMVWCSNLVGCRKSRLSLSSDTEQCSGFVCMGGLSSRPWSCSSTAIIISAEHTSGLWNFRSSKMRQPLSARHPDMTTHKNCTDIIIAFTLSDCMVRGESSQVTGDARPVPAFGPWVRSSHAPHIAHIPAKHSQLRLNGRVFEKAESLERHSSRHWDNLSCEKKKERRKKEDSCLLHSKRMRQQKSPVLSAHLRMK